MITEKRCPDCDEPRPVSEFYSSTTTRTGLSVYCKKHTSDRCKASRAKKKGLAKPIIRTIPVEIPEFDKHTEIGRAKHNLMAARQFLGMAVYSLAHFSEEANAALFMGRAGDMDHAMHDKAKAAIKPMIEIEALLDWAIKHSIVESKEAE